MGHRKQLFILLFLLIFLGYCGDGENKKSENWLSTSDLENLVAPAGLLASCQSAGHIKVQWDPSIDTIATHLKIERKTATEVYAKVVDVAIDDGNFIDEVANGVIYTYRVQAIIKAGEDVQYVSEEYSAEATSQTSNMGCGIVVDPDTPSESETLPGTLG